MVTKKSARKIPPKTKKEAVTKKAAATGPAASLKKAPQKPLLKSPAELAFYCNDGRLFYDLRELAEGLRSMSEAAFYHHVREGNNDFSNWVRDVIQDIELAEDLAGTMEKDEATTYVVARLDYYE